MPESDNRTPNQSRTSSLQIGVHGKIAGIAFVLAIGAIVTAKHVAARIHRGTICATRRCDCPRRNVSGLGVLASGSSERELFYGALVAIILVFGIVYGAKWIDHRERTYPRYAGVLLPQPVIQNGALADNSVRLQIGNSGTFFEGAGIDDILSVLKRDQFNLSVGNGKILVSTKVRDDADNVIAEIEDNEWKIAPPPSTYDRNYSDNALEVKNTKGDIVLQVRMIGNTVQLQGIWWKILASRKLRMVVREAPECKQSPSNCGSQIVFCEPNHECQKILAIFKYPGDSHLGELAR